MFSPELVLMKLDIVRTCRWEWMQKQRGFVRQISNRKAKNCKDLVNSGRHTCMIKSPVNEHDGDLMFCCLSVVQGHQVCCRNRVLSMDAGVDLMDGWTEILLRKGLM